MSAESIRSSFETVIRWPETASVSVSRGDERTHRCCGANIGTTKDFSGDVVVSVCSDDGHGFSEHFVIPKEKVEEISRTLLTVKESSRDSAWKATFLDNGARKLVGRRFAVSVGGFREEHLFAEVAHHRFTLINLKSGKYYIEPRETSMEILSNLVSLEARAELLEQ